MLKTKHIKLFCAALAVLLLWGCGQKTAESGLLADAIASPEDIHYKTATVELFDYQLTDTASVSPVYPVTTSIYWEGGDARYAETLVKTGQKVAAGDILMTFEVAAQASEMAQLELQLKRARQDYAAGAEKRQAAIAREEERAATATSFDLQIAQLTVEKLRAEYDQFVYTSEWEISQLKEQIGQLKAQVENNTIKAPCDGVIDYVIRCNAGDRVTTTAPLVKMHSEDVVLLQVSGSDLRYNMSLTVEQGKTANKLTYTGRVISAQNILPAGITQSKTYIALDQPLDRNATHRNLTACFVSKEICNILVTDRSAINGAGAETFVYVLEDGTLHKRFVVIKRDSGQQVWILDGLTEGQILVTD